MKEKFLLLQVCRWLISHYSFSGIVLISPSIYAALFSESYFLSALWYYHFILITILATFKMFFFRFGFQKLQSAVFGCIFLVLIHLTVYKFIQFKVRFLSQVLQSCQPLCLLTLSLLSSENSNNPYVRYSRSVFPVTSFVFHIFLSFFVYMPHAA